LAAFGLGGQNSVEEADRVSDETGEMAAQCVEMMRSMGAMMGMHGGPDMPMGPMPGGMGSMMTGGLGLPVLLLLGGAIVLLGALLIRRAPGRDARGGSLARAELDRRYVRGDVDRETYLQTRRDLQHARG
jgi:uncharacterized membrane protein